MKIIMELKEELAALKEKIKKTKVELGTEIVIMKEMIESMKETMVEKDAKIKRLSSDQAEIDLIRQKLKNDLEGLQGINGDLNTSQKNMKFNLSQKEQEALKAAAELANLRN